jgi:hypothetical protein
MNENSREARIAPLADCPYCEGEGNDPQAPSGLCRRCYGTGRVARFLAERTLARWARAHTRGANHSRADEDRTGGARYDGIEDAIPPGYRPPQPDGTW